MLIFPIPEWDNSLSKLEALVASIGSELPQVPTAWVIASNNSFDKLIRVSLAGWLEPKWLRSFILFLFGVVLHSCQLAKLTMVLGWGVAWWLGKVGVWGALR